MWNVWSPSHFEFQQNLRYVFKKGIGTDIYCSIRTYISKKPIFKNLIFWVLLEDLES